jgi:hypothetical protein
MQPENHNYTM